MAAWPALAAANMTDFVFGAAQTFDVQWSYNAGTNTLTTSGYTRPYSSTAAAQAANGGSQQVTLQSGQYYRFFDSTTVAGTYGMAVYNANGTVAYVVHETGSYYYVSNDTVFYLGDGFWGTLITTTQGYSYGDAASFSGGIENPTNPQVEGFLPANSVVLGAGQTLAAVSAGLSMVNNAHGLRALFALQSSQLVHTLGADCTAFGASAACVTVAAGSDQIGRSDASRSAAMVVAAWQLSPQWRVGASLDQGLGWQSGSSGLTLHQRQPMLGVFAVWAPVADGSGWAVRGALAHQRQQLRTTRATDAGQGSAALDAQGVSIEASHGLPAMGAWRLSPYGGLRSLHLRRAGYTETSGTATPLTYAPVSQRTTSATVGVRAAAPLAPGLSFNASLGLEHDLSHQLDDYSASGAGTGNLTVRLDGDARRTRPALGIGLYQQLGPLMGVGLTLDHRDQAFGELSTTALRVQLSVGF